MSMLRKSLGRLLGAALLATWASLVAAQATPLPKVDAVIDPAKSYWDTHVHYPFPHHFAKVSDTLGTGRELAYVDLYRGNPTRRDKAPVLVLIHGRTMHSGYWGQLIEAPLAAGFRVISIDWTNTGKSLTRNLDKPLTRTLDDVRHMIHDLVTRHLQIPKAHYLGHSLGGQIVAGYALDYPQAVDRLVLYAPGGLEGFKGSTPKLIARLAHSDRLFKLIWKTGALPDIGENEEKVRGRFYGTRRHDAIPYLQPQDLLGQFIVASHAQALKGKPSELERLRQTHAWDSLASLLESGIDNPRSIRQRLHLLQVPTLMTFGLRDPAFPVPGTGNEHLLEDVIQPLARRAADAQTPLQIKLYEQGGHLLHTDFPEQFSRDVIHFLTTGKVVDARQPGL